MTRVAVNLVRPIFRHYTPLVVDVKFHTPQAQATEFYKLDMKKFLVQGANPIDSKIISREDVIYASQFQGAYRCTLEIVTQPAYGIVKISDDTLGFAYKPNSLIYRGGDSFSYRLRSAMGQASDVACVSLFVRI